MTFYCCDDDTTHASLKSQVDRIHCPLGLIYKYKLKRLLPPMYDHLHAACLSHVFPFHATTSQETRYTLFFKTGVQAVATIVTTDTIGGGAELLPVPMTTELLCGNDMLLLATVITVVLVMVTMDDETNS